MSEYIFATDDHGNQWVKWEEIVRCRDCVYMINQKYKSYEYQTCSYFDSEYAEVEHDGFCKWGEHK